MSDEQTREVDYYARGEAVKTEFLGMIHAAKSPFDILMVLAKYLEETTHEEGYAEKIKNNLRSVYGILLEDKKLLIDELEEVQDRLLRIKNAEENPDFTEEEKKRIRFAIDLHKKNVERLQAMIKQAEAYHKEPYIERY